MTRQEAVKNHRKLWNWIADKTEERKRIVISEEYFKENNLKSIHNDCYVCEYVKQNKLSCKDCPIAWSAECCLDSECKKVGEAETWQERAKWARIIANLPVK